MDYQGFTTKIEVECSSVEDAAEAVRAGADVVMLDNMPPTQLAQASTQLRTHLSSYSFLIEASGGITLDTVDRFMLPNVDVISLGALTQGVPHVDLSLKIQPSSE
jgi:nicotinate-nucleotide pyrophosphorylase (carboxylating)